MGLKEDISGEVRNIFKLSWSERNGIVVPETDNLILGNDGVWLNATILYADMADSTHLVDTFNAKFAAKVYKAFLHAAAKIIRAESGSITAYDGDRIMAVFIGDRKNSSAARAALKINYARCKIINPEIKQKYPDTKFELSHVVGVDTSKVLIARTGIRGANDLVWVGRAANHAAKLASLDSNFPSRITEEVYDSLSESTKISGSGKLMWEPVTWNFTNKTIYRSLWTWEI